MLSKLSILHFEALNILVILLYIYGSLLLNASARGVEILWSTKPCIILRRQKGLIKFFLAMAAIIPYTPVWSTTARTCGLYMQKGALT